MGNAPDSILGTMYKEHIGYIKTQNIDALLNQYDEDCLLISTLTEDKQPLYIRGHKELEQFFRERIFTIQDLDVDLRLWAEDTDRLMIVEEISMKGTDGSTANMRFYDNWFLRDGKIKIHFAGTVRYPDGTYADGTGYSPGQEPAKFDAPADTPMGKMYHEHIAFILEKNVDGILQQYHPEALLIGTLTEGRIPKYIRGRDQLREFFNGNFMGLKSLTTKIDQWAETENTLMMVESIEVTTTDGQVVPMSFYDNWVLVDGMIKMHYAGVIRYPDGDYA